MKINGLIFVYNAQSGVFNLFVDYLHKALFPSTYNCNLCTLTYNNYGEIKIWKQFIQSIKIPVHFKYADHLPKLGLTSETRLPAVFDTNLSLLVSAEEINNCRTTDILIELIRKKLKKEIKI